MGLGTGATAAIVGGIGAAGSVASGLIGAHAAGHAADVQAGAANNAANLERQSAIDALNFNKQQYGNSLTLLSPFYNTGVAANSRLAYLMGLNPAQGLPPGVINPNAPQTNTNGINVRDVLGALRGGDGAFAEPFGGGVRGTGAVPMQANSSMFAKDPNVTVPNTAAPTSNTGGSILMNNLPGEAGNPGGGAVSMSTGNPTPNNGAVSMSPVGGVPSAGGVVQANTNQGGGAIQPMGAGPGGAGTGDFGSLARGYGQTFQSPTDVTEQNDPGYQFRLQQGQQALQNSAAARGGLFSGATAKALSDYNQNAASNEYQNVYNRYLQNFDTNYNVFSNDQNNQFNRLMALQTGGQTTANNLSASGITSANNAANIGLTSAGQIGQQLNNAGAATASGYVGGANAITGAINNGTNNLSTLAMLNMLKGGSGSSASSGGWGVF